MRISKTVERVGEIIQNKLKTSICHLSQQMTDDLRLEKREKRLA
jgi:hypothetical protein